MECSLYRKGKTWIELHFLSHRDGNIYIAHPPPTLGSYLFSLLSQLYVTRALAAPGVEATSFVVRKSIYFCVLILKNLLIGMLVLI